MSPIPNYLPKSIDTYENELDIRWTNKELDEVFEYAAEIDSELINNVMGGDAGREIKRSVLHMGWMFCLLLAISCWGGQWGIYIPISSIAFMMSQHQQSDAAPIDLMRMSIRASINMSCFILQ